MILEFILFILKTSVGYLYPIWASLVLICNLKDSTTISSLDSSKWLSYWVIIAVLHNTLFPFLDLIVEIDYETFEAIVLLIKTAIMTYLNFPYINGCVFIYQKFVFSNEEIETIKYAIRKKMRGFVDLIDLRDLDE